MQEIPQIMVKWKALPVSGPSFRTIAQSPYLYQGSTTNAEMGSILVNQDLRITGRPHYSRKVKGVMLIQHGKIYYKLEEFLYKIKSSKLTLSASQTILYPGMHISSREMTLKVSPSKVGDLRREASKLLKTGKLVQMAEYLRLPALEPYIPVNQEFQERDSNFDSHRLIVEVGYLAFKSQGAFGDPATAITGNDGGTRPQKWKISVNR
ncbi:hypothetical protein AYI68_g2543 [Smittium mucronatum]|uniref:Uncharacterized protein n=1 Tax=Smittium mucronatum TaxID=133383 RepID=A0A1R0H2E5_9FUNG|nr:hypothetical protein AYI68_g2543 [Smittium mucronatum]